jgi:hypothetical protein
MASLDRFLISSKLLAAGDPEEVVPYCNELSHCQKKTHPYPNLNEIKSRQQPIHQTHCHLPYIGKKFFYIIFYI